MTSATMTRPVPTADIQSPEPTYSGIPFSRLLLVEWGKATGTRAARWLLALVAASAVGLMLVPLLASSSIEQTYTSYLGFAAIALSILLPVVAILTMTSEWSQRTVLTTFTQEPRRTRVIRANVAVSGLMGIGAAVFGGLITAIGLGVASATGRDVDSNLSAGVVGGYLLFVLLNVLMGVAFGALLHNTAAAIVLSFVLPTAFGLLGFALQSVAQWVDTTMTFDWVLNAQWAGHTPQILVSASLWVAIPLAAGIVRTVRREIH